MEGSRDEHRNSLSAGRGEVMWPWPCSSASDGASLQFSHALAGSAERTAGPWEGAPLCRGGPSNGAAAAAAGRSSTDAALPLFLFFPPQFSRWGLL